MTHFVGSDDDAAKSTGILDDSDRIDLFETFIHDACPADVRESCANKNLQRITCIYLPSNRALNRYYRDTVGIEQAASLKLVPI